MSAGTQPVPGSAADRLLCDRLRELCEQALRRLRPGPTAEVVEGVLHRLNEPTLRIAVGGRLKAGKSTVVNALLGQRLAATAVTECTLIVAWFRYSHQNRIEVRRRDGRTYHVPGPPGGGVPADLRVLGATREEIVEIVVEVTNQHLASEYTVVDTPGTDSLSGLDDIAIAALSQADVLLYVMPHPGEGDVEALQKLRQLAEAHRISQINVIGVLSRVDLYGDGISDPWPTARRLTDRYSARLTGVVALVAPVVGLLAQTVTSDEYTEADTTLLRRLASVRPDELREALFSHESFLEWQDSPLTVSERQRLLDLLGRYGVVTADEAIRTHVASGSELNTADLLGILRARSGIDELLAHIREQFLASADRLRATTAIAALDAAIDGPQSPADSLALSSMRTHLGKIRKHPLMRKTELGSALAKLSAGRIRLPDCDAAALRCLITASGPAACLGLNQSADQATIARTADEEICRWQRHEWSHSREVRSYARIARELCESFYFDAEILINESI